MTTITTSEIFTALSSKFENCKPLVSMDKSVVDTCSNARVVHACNISGCNAFVFVYTLDSDAMINDDSAEWKRGVSVAGNLYSF